MANMGKMKHASRDQRPNQGENLAWSRGRPQSDTDGAWATDQWYKGQIRNLEILELSYFRSYYFFQFDLEIENYDFATGTKNAQSRSPNAHARGQTGHFTQVTVNAIKNIKFNKVFHNCKKKPSPAGLG